MELTFDLKLSTMLILVQPGVSHRNVLYQAGQNFLTIAQTLREKQLYYFRFK